MNYQEQLLLEHSKQNTLLIANTVGKNPKELVKLIKLLYKGEAPIPQRVSWVLAVANNNHPDLFIPHLKTFIDTITDFKIDGIKRNILHILSSHKIPKNLQGKLVDTCFKYLLNSNETVAVKVYAMQCIANISIEHPELKEELKAVINDQLPKTTAAFHARAKMVLKNKKNQYLNKKTRIF